mgnify:CR=1 FL=1
MESAFSNGCYTEHRPFEEPTQGSLAILRLAIQRVEVLVLVDAAGSASIPLAQQRLIVVLKEAVRRRLKSWTLAHKTC